MHKAGFIPTVTWIDVDATSEGAATATGASTETGDGQRMTTEEQATPAAVQTGDRWEMVKGRPGIANTVLTIRGLAEKGHYGQSEEGAFAVTYDRTGRKGRITARTLLATYRLIERGGKAVGSPA